MNKEGRKLLIQQLSKKVGAPGKLGVRKESGDKTILLLLVLYSHNNSYIYQSII